MQKETFELAEKISKNIIHLQCQLDVAETIKGSKGNLKRIEFSFNAGTSNQFISTIDEHGQELARLIIDAVIIKLKSELADLQKQFDSL